MLQKNRFVRVKKKIGVPPSCLFMHKVILFRMSVFVFVCLFFVAVDVVVFSGGEEYM